MPTATNTSPRTRRRSLELLAGAVLLQACLPLAAGAAGAADPVRAAMPLHCTLTAPARVKLGEPVLLQWQFSNRGTGALQFLVWGTPFDGPWFAPYVQLTRDGRPLDYGGAMVKRGEPEAAAYRSLAPGAALSASVELNTAFDLRRTGRYRVQPQITLHDLVPEGQGAAPRPLAQHASATLACNAVVFVVHR